MKTKFSILIIIAFLLGCTSTSEKTNNKTILNKSSTELEMESIETGIRKDTLTFKYIFGMTQDEVIRHSKTLVAENKIALNEDSSSSYFLQTDNYKLLMNMRFFFEKNKLFRTITQVYPEQSEKINEKTDITINSEVLSLLQTPYGAKLNENMFKNGTKGSQYYWLEGNKRIDLIDSGGNIHVAHSDMLVEYEMLANIEQEEKNKIAKEKEEEKLIISKLKEKAKRDWPDDYTTQEYWINEQIEAYKYMKTIPDDNIKRNAQKDWPLDFSTQKYWYNEQIEARERLNKGHSKS